MAATEVIADLRRAIADVRAECHGDPRCDDLIDLLDRAEEAAKEVSYGDDKNGKKAKSDDRADQDEDRKDGGKDEDAEQPKNLRDAADETRRRFQTARKTRDRDALKRKQAAADDDD